MKRSIRKAIAFIIALALFIPLFSTTAEPVSADSSDFLYSYYEICEYTGNDKDVELPFFDEDISGVYFNFEDGRSDFETLTIEEGYTYVNLSYIDSLKKLTLPSTITSIFIAHCPELTELTIPAACLNVSVFYCPKLQNINFEAPVRTEDSGYTYAAFSDCAITDLHIPSGFADVTINRCENLKSVFLEEGIEYITLFALPALQKLNIPDSAEHFNTVQVPFSGISSSKQFKIENGGLYVNDTLYGIDSTKDTINVKEGTHYVAYLGLSDCSVTTTINLPDSIEEICDFAFSGGTKLKNLTIPKSVISIGGNAFEETAIEKLVIPASVRSIDDSTFSCFRGAVSLNENNKNFETYMKGIYRTTTYDDYTDVRLLYYPADETTITFKPGTTSIGTWTLNYSAIKKLVLPDTLDSFYCYMYDSSISSISIPASVTYLSTDALTSAPKLKTLKISPENEYYSTYKNCLYNKDKTIFRAAPQGLKNISIYKGCLSASSGSLWLKTWDNVYDESTDKKPITVTIPKSVISIDAVYCDKAYIYADSEPASIIFMQNASYQAAGWTNDNSPFIVDYEFLDTNNALLRSTWVVDEISVKKGRKKTIDFSLPDGISLVKKLTLKKNTEMTVRFSSSNKKIAKVNAYTGKITGIKKGKCKITATFTIDNGKKKTSKKFTTTVTVR